MITYYVTIIFVAIFSGLAVTTYNNASSASLHKAPYSTRMCLFICILILTFVAGLRFGVGTDFFAYYDGGRYADKLQSTFRSLDEPGLPFLATIIDWISDAKWAFTFACALITIVLILIPIYKNTEAFFFATMLFVFSGTWHGMFNGVRQYLAAAIVFAGFSLIKRRKLLPYCIVVFLAFLVHKSAIIMIVPYFVLNLRVCKKNLIFIAIGTIAVALNLEMVFSFVGFLKDSDISSTSTAYNATQVSIFRVLAGVAPAVFFLILYQGKEKTKDEEIYINALILNAAFRIASMNSAYLARVGIYSSIYLPLALTNLKNYNNKKMEAFFKFSMLALYFIFWYVEVSGSSSLSRFRWVWEANR